MTTLRPPAGPDTLHGGSEAAPGEAGRVPTSRAFPVLAVPAVAAVAVCWLLGGCRQQPAAGADAQAGADSPPASPAGSMPVSPPEIPFVDITAAAGIDFVHRNGAEGAKLLPETMGGGVAFFDHDNDGDQDLLFVGSSAWPGSVPRTAQPPSLALYDNDGAGHFTDITVQAGLGLVFYGMGPAVGDFDGDGDQDLFVTAVGRNRLLRNEGGRFVEVTDQAGVAGEHGAWSTGAAFADLDDDGDLDLFVCNYVRWSQEIDHQLDFRLEGVGRAYGPPQSYQGTMPYLYRNEGGGVFADITASSGVEVRHPATGEPLAKALAVLPTDIDDDGLVDLLVANDTVRNLFFHNLGGGRFEEVAELTGLAYDQAGRATGAMGVDASRHRNGEDLILAVGNFADEMSSLYISQGDRSFFVDEAIAAGLGGASRRPLTFGLLFFDADLDGQEDLLQVNGHLEEQIAVLDARQSYRQPAQLFWNDGQAGFAELAAIGDLARPVAGRGVAYADIDADGDLDLAVAQNGAPALLLRNDRKARHGWLRLRLVGRPANSAAIGARVELSAGGKTQRREVRPTRSYLSQVELILTFSMNQTSDNLIKISWPDGRESTVRDLAGGTVHTLIHPDEIDSERYSTGQ